MTSTGLSLSGEPEIPWGEILAVSATQYDAKTHVAISGGFCS